LDGVEMVGSSRGAATRATSGASTPLEKGKLVV
jgi:hypothetical protein